MREGVRVARGVRCVRYMVRVCVSVVSVVFVVCSVRGPGPGRRVHAAQESAQNQNTPLHLACVTGNDLIVDTLLKYKVRACGHGVGVRYETHPATLRLY